MAGRAYQEISTGGILRAKREKRGLVLHNTFVLVFIRLFFSQNQMERLQSYTYVMYVFNTAAYVFLIVYNNLHIPGALFFFPTFVFNCPPTIRYYTTSTIKSGRQLFVALI